MNDRKAAYQQFVHSPRWRAIRQAAISIYGRNCQVCGAQWHIQFHHLFYAHRWEDTKVEHLMPLCRGHHKMVASLAGAGVTTLESDVPSLREKLIRNLPNRLRGKGSRKKVKSLSKKQKRAQTRERRQLKSVARWKQKIKIRDWSV